MTHGAATPKDDADDDADADADADAEVEVLPQDFPASPRVVVAALVPRPVLLPDPGNVSKPTDANLKAEAEAIAKEAKAEAMANEIAKAKAEI
jgi:hypothetical protein